ncbi:heterokaryon incompatibility protein-domain-containing protein, partial [Hyaloscypha finlandica]
EALSYEWGSNETKTITLNGDDYDIRTNLFDALRRLRWEMEERILWVDAICINQHDVRERNHQVSRMASIYSQARHVVVWLREPLDCGISLGFLESIAENELEETINHVFRTKRSSKWGLQVLKGIQALSRKQYWTRLWVVQEALLASNTKIQCGPYCVPWGILKYVCQYLQSFISTYDTKETIYKTATAISESRM